MHLVSRISGPVPSRQWNPLHYDYAGFRHFASLRLAFATTLIIRVSPTPYKFDRIMIASALAIMAVGPGFS